jgi:hypothetical protein
MAKADLVLRQSFPSIRGTSTAHCYVCGLRFPSIVPPAMVFTFPLSFFAWRFPKHSPSGLASRQRPSTFRLSKFEVGCSLPIRTVRMRKGHPMRVSPAWLSPAHFARRLAEWAKKLLRDQIDTGFEYVQFLLRQGVACHGVGYERITCMHEFCDGLG